MAVPPPAHKLNTSCIRCAIWMVGKNAETERKDCKSKKSNKQLKKKSKRG